MLFPYLLKQMIRHGTLRYIDPRGRRHTFGDGEAPRATLRVKSKAVERKLVINPPLAFGEAYMDGSIDFEDSSLADVLDVTARNYDKLENHWLVTLGFALSRNTRRLQQYNPIGKARQNVAHHYDLSGELYDLFLDRDRQYSCAYYTSPDDDLEVAQENKKRHVAAKLLLDRPGLRVLDIGSGWGGLGLYLAQVGDCDVTGVTLSVEQQKVSQARAQLSEMHDRLRFVLRDYREDEGPYDRIVSVGMFKHVGKKNYPEFFAKLRQLLTDDGVCLLHTIGRSTQPGPISPFMRKYIFPGADLPNLSEILPKIEESGLYVTDVEVLRLHYAETLKAWSERFQANRAKVAEIYDERFCRMWELYLQGCEQSFRHQDMVVFQIQLAKTLDRVPLTRDYIHDWEHLVPLKEARAAE